MKPRSRLYVELDRAHARGALSYFTQTVQVTDSDRVKSCVEAFIRMSARISDNKMKELCNYLQNSFEGVARVYEHKLYPDTIVVQFKETATYG